MFEFLMSVLLPSILCAICWGVTPYLDDKGLILINNNHNLALATKFIAGGILAIILLVVVTNKLKTKSIKNNLNLYKALSVLIISGFFLILGYYFFFKALRNTKSLTLVVLITYILPIIITAIISCLFLNETFNLGMFFGLIISIIGITLFIVNCKK